MLRTKFYLSLRGYPSPVAIPGFKAVNTVILTISIDGVGEGVLKLDAIVGMNPAQHILEIGLLKGPIKVGRRIVTGDRDFIGEHVPFP